MARLNEPPAPAPESIEALKRRFIRQNREIARVNSNQSVRIRNLEIEISRLLAENILLREEAINAKVEAEKWKATQRLSREVSRMKGQLEGKLIEVNALVLELGNLPEKVARRSSERRRRSIQASSLMRGSSGEEREMRRRLTLSEQEGRLPAILEDKCYPRRTLDAIQVSHLLNESPDDALESPDLGPPPIAHFDDQDVVTFDAVRSPRRTSTELIEESERNNKIGTTSAESRRKRRTSALLRPSTFEAGTVTEVGAIAVSAISTVAVDSLKKDEQLPTNQPSRIGSKRKLEMSELEDTSHVSKEVDDFIFQRKALATKTAPRPSRFSRPPGRQNQENAESSITGSPDKSTLLVRRALAPKSTNSPTKKHLEVVSDKAPKQDLSNELGGNAKIPSSRIRSRLAVTTAEPSKANLESTATQELGYDHAPKTPAVELGELASPFSADPSTIKQRPAQEMAITNSVEDVLNGSIGRGSRRARAAVSYAEPNLRDKMRRPGKALVGAVEGLTRTSVDVDRKDDQGASTESRDKNVEVGPEGGTKVNAGSPHLIRRQKEHVSESHNTEPVSPLGYRKTSLQRLSSAKTIVQGVESQKAVSSISVFDGPDSSPATDTVAAETSVPSQPSTFMRPASRTIQSSGTSAGLPALRTRKPEIVPSTQRPTSASNIDIRKANLKRSASITTLQNQTHLNMNEIAPRPSRARAGSISSPTEIPDDLVEPPSRTSPLTRRRSMMV